MKILIVYAHPEPKSFNGALKDIAVEVLEAQGHTVTVSDLYAQGFNPVASPGDMTTRMDPETFNLAREQGYAAENDGFAPDIQAEMDKVLAADFLILQAPMWWFSVPAILKGWVDRVLAFKIAYGLGQWWDKGIFAGRRAMLSITTGQPAPAFLPDGRNGDIERILWPVNAGVLRICGYDVLPPQISYASPWVGEEGRQAIFDQYRERLANWQTDVPLTFHNMDEFGEDMRLLPEIEPHTPGQHRPAHLSDD